MNPVLASIVISNYNYGRFLPFAIDSALRQTYSCTEVIVVDDGSTDDSRDIIAGFANRIIPILKANGGQNSAVNAGFAASRGDIVLFLDADDILCPSAVERASRLFQDPNVVEVHWPMWDIDANGTKTGGRRPGHRLPEGALRDLVLRDGPDAYINSPTSGNAWSRRMLEAVLPIPPLAGTMWSDAYLFGLAALFGAIGAIQEPQGSYRLHGRNQYASLPFDERVEADLRFYDVRCDILAGFCRDHGIDVDPATWKEGSWLRRLKQATSEIDQLVPAGQPFILVDDDAWAMGSGGKRHPIPFMEKNGQYWGPPADDSEAIRELERQQRAGVRFVVFTWPSFWWLDYYGGLNDHLRTNVPCVIENDRLVAFDLQERSRNRAPALRARHSDRLGA
jgi:glycosyltransferase involved in cell wall biosynthesis